ncbi:MAG: transporter [Pseudomonadota bacterium]
MSYFKPIAAIGFFSGPLLLAFSAEAQSTGSVFGPSVRATDRSIEYRGAVVPEEDGDESKIDHRLHYQHALNDGLRLRAIVKGSSDGGDDLIYDYFQTELQWQYQEKTDSGYAAALRFDGRLTDEGRGSDQLGLNWTHNWQLGDGWSVRAIGLTDYNLDEDADDGLFIETRGALYRKLSNGVRLGAESFIDWGGTDTGFGSFNDQGHQLGPVVSFAPAPGWSLQARALFGLSDGADDADISVFLTRRFD